MCERKDEPHEACMFRGARLFFHQTSHFLSLFYQFTAFELSAAEFFYVAVQQLFQECQVIPGELHDICLLPGIG